MCAAGLVGFVLWGMDGCCMTSRVCFVGRRWVLQD